MSGIVTRTIGRLLLLPILITAVAFLVRGYSSPGDGFSAGIIAATGVLLQFITCGHRRVIGLLRLSHAGEVAFVGLLIAFLVTFVPLAFGAPLLAHFPRPGHEPIYLGKLELHTALLFDLGVFLLIFGFAIAASHIVAAEADARADTEAE